MSTAASVVADTGIRTPAPRVFADGCVVASALVSIGAFSPALASAGPSTIGPGGFSSWCTPTDMQLAEMSGLQWLGETGYAIADRGSDDHVAVLDAECRVDEWIEVSIDTVDIEDLARGTIRPLTGAAVSADGTMTALRTKKDVFIDHVHPDDVVAAFAAAPILTIGAPGATAMGSCRLHQRRSVAGGFGSGRRATAAGATAPQKATRPRR
ncbi:hypothetical protein R4P64_30850 [Rhodococcus sp. IEGM 1366]|uniref:hypothetical protein n=1 Tax=Rhodococcus sp. IEGM 1366 TaxID=3082223 RepID=UPI0029553C1D|nr:hypothetical protein [Rhodococcus sp. IEGM 1366]MDV8070927.1 hypothetical protein [Rhodococcus sp. IEGM 1366]